MVTIGRSRSKARSIVLFDIGASSIGVALGVVDNSEVSLVWHMRLEYAYGHVDEYERYTKAMYSTLLEAGMALLNDGVRIAERYPTFQIRHAEVVCVLAPPWFFGAVHRAVHTTEKRRVVTHGMLDELRGRMCTEVQQRPEYVAWATVGGDGELLEQHDLARYFDGYRITSGREYEAQECQLVSYLAFAPQPVMRQIEEIVRRVLPNHPVRICTSTLLLARLRLEARADLSPVHRELLIEVGGQVTSVSLIEQGALVNIATRPTGIHQFLQACAPHAKTIDEAVGLTYTVINKTEGDVGKLPENVLAAVTAWADEIHQAIAHVSDGVTPPAQAALAIRGSWYPVFARALGAGWMWPGVREARESSIVTCEIEPSEKDGAANLGTHGDGHAYTLLCALARGNIA